MVIFEFLKHAVVVDVLLYGTATPGRKECKKKSIEKKISIIHWKSGTEFTDGGE